MMCKKCCKMCGGLVLAAGLGFLLQDLGVWGFFGLSWYTVAFLLVGMGKMGRSCCKDCDAECDPKKKK